MNKFYLILALFTLAFSCNPKETATEDAQKKETTTEDKYEEVVDEEYVDQQVLAQERLNKSYNEEYIIDTTLYVSDTVEVKFMYYSLQDSALNIPASYYGNEKPFIAHNFASDIQVSKGGEVIFNETVTKHTFDELLTDELNRYGALLFPSFREYKTETKELVFHYSITVPATDIGTSATLYVDLEGNKKIEGY